MFGLLWAASSLSTNSSTASIDEEVGLKAYKEEVTEISLLYPGGSAYKIEWLRVLYDLVSLNTHHLCKFLQEFHSFSH